MGRFWLTLLVLISTTPAASPKTNQQSTQTFDLRPYGFVPTRNEDYAPRDYSSLVQYLSDGSIVIAFHSQALVGGARDPEERNLQPMDLLRIDSRSGQLLARAQVLVTPHVAFMWPTNNGILLFSGNSLSFLDPALKPVRRVKLPAGVTAVGMVPSLNEIAAFVQATDFTQTVKMIDLATLEVRESYEVVSGSHPAFLQEGFVVVVHDKEGNRLLRVRDRSNEHMIALPQLPCASRAVDISPVAALVITCGHYTAVNAQGAKLVEGDLSIDEDQPQVFSASKAPRFGLASIAGFAGYPRFEQRRYGREYHVVIFDLVRGKKIFSLKVKPMPKLGGAFALSPDGRKLAILKDGLLEQVPID